MQPTYPSYAPPKPVFGKACLFSFLGCLGVSFLAAVIGAILIAPRIKQAAKGEVVTAKSLRVYLPEDVPLYPGMTLNEQQTNSAWMALRVAQSFDKKAMGKPPRQFVFTSPNKGPDVLKWYVTQMPRKGWTGGINRQNVAGVLKMEMAVFRKGGRGVMLQTVQMDPKQVTMMYFATMPERDPDSPFGKAGAPR
jgi:hypothetical protein